MKFANPKYHVYTLLDENSNIVYVGKTKNPDHRLKQHKSKSGKFYNQLVKINVIDVFDSNKQALDFEGVLKSQCNFSWSEQEARKLGGQTTGKINAKNNHLAKIRHLVVIEQFTCPHCNKVGKSNAMKRWHFNNCKTKN